MYLPTYGRFAQPDPAYDHSEDALNLYSYCSNNPVTRTDPDGMRDISGGGGGSGHDTHYLYELNPNESGTIPGASYEILKGGGTGIFGPMEIVKAETSAAQAVSQGSNEERRLACGESESRTWVQASEISVVGVGVVSAEPGFWIDKSTAANVKKNYNIWKEYLIRSSDTAIRAGMSTAFTFAPGVGQLGGTGYSLLELSLGGFQPVQWITGRSDFLGNNSPDALAAASTAGSRIGDYAYILKRWGFGKPGQIGNQAGSKLARNTRLFARYAPIIGIGFSIMGAYLESQQNWEKCRQEEILSSLE